MRVAADYDITDLVGDCWAEIRDAVPDGLPSTTQCNVLNSFLDFVRLVLSELASTATYPIATRKSRARFKR